MKPEPNSSSNDKIPSFFLKDDKPTDELFQNDDTNSFKHVTERQTKLPKQTVRIHWPSLGIGAGIAIICMFCGIMMTNMLNTESTQILDEDLLKVIPAEKKYSLSVFLDNASPVLGNKNAPLTVIEFGDYQCCLLYTSPSPRD